MLGTLCAASRPRAGRSRPCCSSTTRSPSRRSIRGWTRSARSTPRYFGRTPMPFGTAASKPHTVKRRACARPHTTDQGRTRRRYARAPCRSNQPWPHRARPRESTRATPSKPCTPHHGRADASATALYVKASKPKHPSAASAGMGREVGHGLRKEKGR
jgi:hypothetical protein